jgi:hypothetical protein
VNAHEVLEDRDLVTANRWEPKVNADALSERDRVCVADRVDELAAERRLRADAHRALIRSTAARLGRDVAAHVATLADAEARIGRLLDALDPESPVPIPLVPIKQAKRLAEDAFASTYRETSWKAA